MFTEELFGRHFQALRKQMVFFFPLLNVISKSSRFWSQTLAKFGPINLAIEMGCIIKKYKSYIMPYALRIKNTSESDPCSYEVTKAVAKKVSELSW